jgi:hypothetical protein
MNEELIPYFGYGANRDTQMMEEITGAQGLVGSPATLKGWGLCVQRIDQVPNVVLASAPAPVSVRTLLDNACPPDFVSYTIRPDPDNEVTGMIFMLNPLQRELVRNWELIDFGWYRDIKVSVVTPEGESIPVQTEALGEGQEVDREVNGHDYPTFLNDREFMRTNAESARSEYFEMIGVSP